MSTVATAEPKRSPRSGAPRLRLPAFSRVPPLDLAVATRQGATLVGADIPLVDSLSSLAEQVENTRLKSVLTQVRDRVNEGASLADARAEAEALGDWQRIQEVAALNQRVTASAPYVSGQALMVSGEQLSGVELRGIDPDQEDSVSGVADVMVEGELGSLETGVCRG